MAEFITMTDLEFTKEWTKNMLDIMTASDRQGGVDAKDIMRKSCSFCYYGKHIIHCQRG